MSKILAFMTATAVEIAGSEDERGERNGWIDLDWSRTTMHDSRDDVTPLMNEDESDTTAVEEKVRDILGDGSLFADNGDGSFHEIDETKTDNESWTYVVHFSRQSLGLNGEWIDDPWHPETDGGISLI